MTTESLTAAEILTFWFGDDGAVRNDLWFGGGPAFDALIRERFGEHVRRAAAGDYQHWMGTARESLALIILLDQFTRNVHRGRAASWWLDPLAQRIAADTVDSEQDKQLPLLQRVFCYLPFEHSEDRDLQARSVACYEQLLEDSPDGFKENAQAYLLYAQRHRAVVERFGRFPHRNPILGRESTAEELAFVAEHGTGF